MKISAGAGFDVPALYFTSAKRDVLMCDSVDPLAWEYSLSYRTDVCQQRIGGFCGLPWKNVVAYAILFQRGVENGI